MTAHQLLLAGTMVNTLVDLRNMSIWGIGDPGDGVTAGVMWRPDGTTYVRDEDLTGWYNYGVNWLVVGAASDYKMRVYSYSNFFSTNVASGQFIVMSTTISVTKTVARTASATATGWSVIQKVTDSSTIAVGSLWLRASGGG